MNYKTDIIGDDIISIEAQDAAHAQSLANHLRKHDQWEEVVVGLSSVVVRYNPLDTNHAKANADIQNALQTMPDKPVQTPVTITIPVSYGGEDGLDFQMVCESLNLTSDEFIRQHTNSTYPVEMIGFLPGFAYIGGFEHSQSIPRLQTPRTRVPAGSIGMITGYTGIYPLAGPGGWPLIGRTEKSLFNSNAKDPFIIRAGFNVKFETIR